MKTKASLLLLVVSLLGGQAVLLGADPPIPVFRAVDVDTKIEIGYGVAVADVDGDGKPDILLADKKQFVWYKNSTWQKFVLAENLTKEDNVCIAAADIDGDGKAEVAVGAGWNPSDTVNSGAVFYLIPPKDRTQKWEPVQLPHEPTTHRMRWVRRADWKFDLVVVPLHGRGNKNGEGEGVRILAYKMPATPRERWKTELISDSILHMTHNFWPTPTPGGILVAGKEGIFGFTEKSGVWHSRQFVGRSQGHPDFAGAGEVQPGRLLVTIEPMHGNQVVVYAPTSGFGNRRCVIDSSLKEGHALRCRELLGSDSDQIVAGWRAKNADGKVGIKIYTLLDYKDQKWKETLLDDNTMACEDLCLGDLNGDGKLDIVASGRATKNVKVYFNESATKAQ